MIAGKAAAEDPLPRQQNRVLPVAASTVRMRRKSTLLDVAPRVMLREPHESVGNACTITRTFSSGANRPARHWRRSCLDVQDRDVSASSTTRWRSTREKSSKDPSIAMRSEDEQAVFERRGRVLSLIAMRGTT